MFHAAGVPVEPVVFDVLPGKHGDHVGGERDAVKALVAGQVDAACLIDGNQLVFSRDGTLPTGATRVLARSEPYDHCVFTAIRGHKDPEVGRFSALLQSMKWEDPVVRPLLELEGLREWRPGRVSGFGALNRAIDGLGFAGAAAVRAFVAR
jgi:ABC-type phosphate/phosphonate transport system substrate-binding protein